MAVQESGAIFIDLIHHSARPPSAFLRKLAHDTRDGPSHRWRRFKELVMQAVESAKNPLIPGMSLSIALSEAAERAREGEERRLSDLRRDLDEYMMEVLERLPQTVRGFEDGIRGCSGLFEPEGSRGNLVERPGPLRLAFGRRQQMEGLCAVPLVMDYLFNRFTCGVPDLRDSHRVLQNKDELHLLANAGGFNPTNPTLCIGNPANDSGEGIWRLFQGVPWREDLPALTFLPGAQFIITGMLTVPRSYYKVPAMRMAMDFVVYLAMVVAYCNLVLLHNDGPVSKGEILFACYILASLCTPRIDNTFT